MQLLVIDDDPSVRADLAINLPRQWCDCQVAIVPDAERGLHYLAHHEPDLVLMGLRDPMPTGIELLRMVGQLSDVPVIVMDGPHDEIAEVRSFALGAHAYLDLASSAP
jgi:DNA-binding response OmpR family regulator